jgi:hypothetical protein
MGFVALTMAARVDQDEAIIGFQSIDITHFVPSLTAVGIAVLEDKRRSISLNTVMDGNPVIDDARHRVSPEIAPAQDTPDRH